MGMSEGENKPQQAPKQVPSTGRIVHFVYGDQHYAAIITAPAARQIGPDGTIEGQGLVVFPPGDEAFTTVAVNDESGAPGTWHWPEFVPAKG
jgi:hypothetical protein